MDADNNKITCPKCNSQNIQSEGVIHLCMDCGYKWEDEIQTDLGEMIIYQSDEGVRLDVRLENKTVWLNIEQISQLFNKGRTTISEHISNIFKEGELEEKVVCRKFRQTTQYGAIEGKVFSVINIPSRTRCHGASCRWTMVAYALGTTPMSDSLAGSILLHPMQWHVDKLGSRYALAM